jgi:5-formyltetrahydrofolate cyclo-ligase
VLFMTQIPSKTQLRRHLRQARKAITGFNRHRQQQRIYKALASIPALRQALRIGAYMPFDGEPDLAPYLGCHQNKIWLPVIRADWHLDFRPGFTLGPAHQRPAFAYRNRFGIWESLHQPTRRAAHLDVILIPLVGFDRRGNRLGMGAGFYDRSLACLRRPKPKLIGIAFSVQEVAQLPADPWDIPLDYIVTDREIIKTARSINAPLQGTTP